MVRSGQHYRMAIAVAGLLALGGIAVPSAKADITHRYSFNDGTTNDSVGTANGVAVVGTNAGDGAGPTVSGGVLNLNNPGFSGPSSTGNYLSLPASILPSSGSATIESWFTFTGSGFFSEDWTFSDNHNDTTGPNSGFGQYLMHTISAPQPATPPGGANTGGSHIAQTTSGYGPETDAFETTSGIGAGGGGYLDDGGTYMSATVIDASAGTLSYYLYETSNGNLGGLQQAITAIPLSSYNFTNAYLGRSAFAGDDDTSGSIDEFRIYNDAQSADQIAADLAAGPNTVVATPEPASLSIAAIGVLGLLTRRRTK